jgi:hypothetical protein
LFVLQSVCHIILFLKYDIPTNVFISLINCFHFRTLCKFIKVITVKESLPGEDRYYVSAHVLYNLCICCIYHLYEYAYYMRINIIHSFIRSFVRSYIHSFIHSFIHSYFEPTTNIFDCMGWWQLFVLYSTSIMKKVTR